MADLNSRWVRQFAQGVARGAYDDDSGGRQPVSRGMNRQSIEALVEPIVDLYDRWKTLPSSQSTLTEEDTLVLSYLGAMLSEVAAETARVRWAQSPPHGPRQTVAGRLTQQPTLFNPTTPGDQP